MEKFEREHAKYVALMQKRMQDILDSYEREITRLAGAVTADPGRPFRFADYPALKARYDKLIKDMGAELQQAVESGVMNEWSRADKKNDALAIGVVGSVHGAAARGCLRRNEEALTAFLGRKAAGMTLSDRVWLYTNQYDAQIQAAIDVALIDGKSAAELSRDVRSYLVHPDTLFRRVRDERGVLHLSQNAKAFHPGQGVYRSAYMNARRMAATEINMAYRTSDYMRIQQMDFVVGIEVHLSGNHNCKGVPPGQFYDICDELQGRYPKTFKFTGWHPHCRCYTTTILKSREEMKEDAARIKEGKSPTKAENSPQAVTKLPDNFTKWLADNQQRVATAKRLPYFLKDNGHMEGDVWVPFQKLLPPAKPISSTTQVKDYTLKAKTIAEAELEISSRLGVTCNLKGFTKNDIKQVQDIFASAAENIDKFPGLKDKIKFVGTMQGRKELFVKKFYEELKQRLAGLGFKDDLIMKTAKKNANRYAEIKSTWYAYSAPSDKFGLNGVAFNATWKGDRVVKQLEYDLKSKFHPEGCATVKSIFDHELGHKIDETLGLRKNADFDVIYIEARAQGNDYIRENLSGYANTDMAEFIAECWSEYLNNPKPREIARKVGELIEKLIRQRKTP